MKAHRNFLTDFLDSVDKAVSQGFPADEGAAMKKRMTDWVEKELVPRMDEGIRKMRQILDEGKRT